LVLTTLAHAKLVFSDLLGARADIEEAGRLLDSVDGVDRTVHSQYYAVAADYYKVSSPTRITFKYQQSDA